MITVARIETASKTGVAHAFDTMGNGRSLCGRLDGTRRDVRGTYESVQCEACDRKLQARRKAAKSGFHTGGLF